MRSPSGGWRFAVGDEEALAATLEELLTAPEALDAVERERATVLWGITSYVRQAVMRAKKHQVVTPKGEPRRGRP